MIDKPYMLLDLDPPGAGPRFTHPSEWHIRKGGRETPARVYVLEQATVSKLGWGEDPFYRKGDEIVARFDTLPEAEEFRARMAEAVAQQADAKVAAHEGMREAQIALRRANANFREALGRAIEEGLSDAS